MSVKTVFHWGNLAKVAATMAFVVPSLVWIIGWAGLGGTSAGSFVAFVGGGAGTLAALVRWPGWHFE
jgi:hypothetical protein